MKTSRDFDNGIITSQSWKLEDITINHNSINYNSLSSQKSSNTDDVVRMHFGMHGSYSFSYAQLKKSYHLHGHHNNIMYSKGLEIEVRNLENRIETLGINFATNAFVKIAQQGNDLLKRFADDVLSGQEAILSDHWRSSTPKMMVILQDILENPYQDALQDLFLYSKSIELLVLQATLYSSPDAAHSFSIQERDKLIAARNLLENQLDQPPTLSQLSKDVGLSEYKLKTGFKTLFDTTAYGYINTLRLERAKMLLLDTSKSVKEISYDMGFSSPQHFSKAFNEPSKCHRIV